MAIKRPTLLWCISSKLLLLASLTANAQFVSQWSLDAIRVGIDPIKSGSIFFNPDNYKNRPVFYSFAEGYVEFLIHLRTSVVIEAGYSNSNWNRFNNTVFYNSKGQFVRVGLDFNVSEPDPDYEVDLGWRIGVNSFKEKSQLVLHGDYWDENIDRQILNSNGSTYWGELLLDTKYRLFRNSERQFFSNLWFHASLRLRFKQSDLAAEQEGQYFMLPGYGFNSRFMPGVHFALSYFIKIRERKVYRIHHVYDSKVLIKHR